MNKKPFAKKSLGQNFLVDRDYIGKIIDAVDPRESDTIIEIGPGRGAITERLVESGGNIIAIELDRNLVPELQNRFAKTPNFLVVEADATQVDFAKLSTENPQSAKLVANLPYYISTAILQHLTTQRHVFSSLVLMFQREVVDRITAPPGSSDRGFLTVLTEASFEVKKLFDVPPNAFRPIPKVVSSVAQLTPKAHSVTDNPAFRSLVSTAFAQKRKTIANNLKAAYPDAQSVLERSAIDPKRRAESLSLDEWLRLSVALNS